MGYLPKLKRMELSAKSSNEPKETAEIRNAGEEEKHTCPKCGCEF